MSLIVAQPLSIFVLFIINNIFILFIIASYFHCWCSFQVNSTLIVSIINFISFLIYTFSFVNFSLSDLFLANNSFLYIKWLKTVFYLFTLLLLYFLSWNCRFEIDNLIAFLWLAQKLKVLFIYWFEVLMLFHILIEF